MDFFEQLGAFGRDVQVVQAPVGFRARARDQSLLDQSVEHLDDRRFVERDHVRQARLIDARHFGNHVQRRVLHRGQPERRRLFEKQRHRDLVQAPDQVARPGIELFERHARASIELWPRRSVRPRVRGL